MGPHHVLASLSLTGLTVVGAQAIEQAPTMMEAQTSRAIALCHAVNAKIGSDYICGDGRLAIRQQGPNMTVSLRIQDKAGKILDIPLVIQHAKRPNSPATFTWIRPNLDKILPKK